MPGGYPETHVGENSQCDLPKNLALLKLVGSQRKENIMRRNLKTCVCPGGPSQLQFSRESPNAAVQYMPVLQPLPTLTSKPPWPMPLHS